MSGFDEYYLGVTKSVWVKTTWVSQKVSGFDEY